MNRRKEKIIKEDIEWIDIQIFLYNKHRKQQMRTPCAFHPQYIITQFCKCEPCLLPLCPQCIPIHLNEHSSISTHSHILPIQSVFKQISSTIQNQHKYINTITVETMNKYRESDDQHRKLFGDIIKQRDKIIQWVTSVYDSILVELESNAKRREAWISEFNQSVLELREQLNSLQASLKGEKYLRVIIMWNKMKPNQAIEQITRKAQKKWLKPSFSGCKQEEIVDFIANHTNLKVLEIEGDSGVNKILQIIRILRYGEPQRTGSSSLTSLDHKQNQPQIKSAKQLNIQKQPPVFSHPVQPNIMLSPQIPSIPREYHNRVSQVHHFSFIPNSLPSTQAALINPPTVYRPQQAPLTNLNIPPSNSYQPNIIPPHVPIQQIGNNYSNNLNMNYNQNNLIPQNPSSLGSPTRKNSTKKIEVLSSLQFQREVKDHGNKDNGSKQFQKSDSRVGQIKD